MILAGVLFVVTYLLLLVLPNHRAAVALLGAAAFVVTGALRPVEALRAVDWNVLLMIAGTMGLVSLFAASKMPMRLADELLHRTSGVRTAVVALALFAGLVSALIDNVATVLMSCITSCDFLLLKITSFNKRIKFNRSRYRRLNTQKCFE